MSVRRNTLILLVIIALAFIAGQLFGQVPEGTAIARPIDAAAWALNDSLRSGGNSDRGTRYVWIPAWMDAKASARVNSFAVNTAISRGSAISRPALSAQGAILRWRFGTLAGTSKDVAAILAVWEKLADTESYFLEDGKPAFHAGPALEQLIERTGSKVPIVRADWLLAKILTTTNGGLYYEFQGIESQDQWLKSFGVDLAATQQLNGDLRAALIRSNITGSRRRVDLFRGAFGLVSLTHDVKEGNRAVESDPIRNLLAFQDDAREGIAQKANGLQSFLLADNRGQLQNAAPPDVAADHTVPAPHTAQVIAARSCISCHGPENGWKPIQNDLAKLLKNIDVYGDNAAGDQEAAVQRLAAIYSGDIDRTLQRAREDYNAAVKKAAGGLTAAQVSALTTEQMAVYDRDQVTPAQAVAELGIKLADPSDGQAALRWLLPPLGNDENGITPEDPVVAALFAGLDINRADWERVYPFTATRAISRFKGFVYANR